MTFTGHFELLISFVGPTLPDWTEARVEEEENGRKRPGSTPLREFDPRFQEILKATTRSWVNLNADRVESGVLYAVVAYITRTDSSAVKVPTDKISVNLSGPIAANRRQ